MTVASLVHSNIVRSRCSGYRTEARQDKKIKRFLAWVFIFAVFVCGFLYIFVTNNIVAKGYEIRNLTKQANELDSINKNLQVEVSNLKSIHALGAKSDNLEMTKAQKIDYVSLPKSSALLVQ
jgi:cell division protein FtsL